MILPKIINAGVYRKAEQKTQTVPVLFLGLYMHGLRRSTIYAPDGTLFRRWDPSMDRPTLGLTPKGFRNTFDYGPDRENWVIMLAFPALKYNLEEHRLYWHCNGYPLAVPMRITLKEDEVAEFRHKFHMVCTLYAGALPQNLLEAELTVLDILRRFLQFPRLEDDAVEQFRKQLEEDQNWSCSITEHCVRLGVNRDQLRREFFDRYKIAPGEYRVQMRLRKIRHLLAYSDMTLKEIAYETGMKNLSHLSSFIRERCGKPPSQLRREYRSGESG